VLQHARPEWSPDGDVPARLTGGTCVPYGLTTWGDLFTQRQLVALKTVSDLARGVRDVARHDAEIAWRDQEGALPPSEGCKAPAYADAISVFAACVCGKLTESHTSICTWSSAPKNELVVSTFRRQALPMTWDFAEANPFADSSGSVGKTVDAVARVLDLALPGATRGTALQADASAQVLSIDRVVSTDPPYYDNIGYADLSDFFYVWMRPSLRTVFPDLFSTLAVPKGEELVATPYRHRSREAAETFFLDGMTRTMQGIAAQAHVAYPVTIYYAFKQSERDGDVGTASTGWETFLDAVIRAGFALTGTWPIRTERSGRSIGIGANALASSIVLVCRPRAIDAPAATRRELTNAIKAELPSALAELQAGNIAPVDLAQAAIGPGMAVYTRYSKVLDAEGRAVTVRDALALINQVLDEALAEQEGDFDADTRWALAWCDQNGFDTGEFGVADVLARAKNTSVSGMVEAGILASSRGKVRLLKPAELPKTWDPATDTRLTVWEIVHHLLRLLEAGELKAAKVVAKLGAKAEVARELAYRLYTLCERKKRAADALAYNALVQSWPELLRLAQKTRSDAAQGGLFGEE